MNAERWRQITNIFEAAIQRDPATRSAYIKDACAGDEELGREVEALMASHNNASQFIEDPAIAVAARDSARVESLVKQRVAHYQVLSLLGSGGMGDVYLAQDTKLGRRVALKVLPQHLADNTNRARLFMKEARAASALNHPNIITVYEIGEVENRYYLAMEYVEGETLREKIYGQQTSLDTLLNYLQQVTEGLAKAHAAGIVHRDLKPDNIMITRDGYAKILDFGLAKLVDPPSQTAPAATEDETAFMAPRSIPGVVMGTVGYMSPEQALGKVKEIDQRSDIFSIGCILFELVTRRKPFEGKDMVDSLHKIIHAPTPLIKETNPDVPDELQRIVRRCLAKDPEQRYQTAKEFLIELKDLKSEESGVGVAINAVPLVQNTEAQAVQTNPITQSERRANYRFILGLLLLLALISIAGYVLLKRRTAPPTTTVRSIAVLPFKPLVNSERNEPLEMGMADTLIFRLSGVRGLVVRPISAVRKYTDLNQDAVAAGKEQQVDAVLDSSLQIAGERIRVTTRLVRVDDGSVLWTERFEDQLKDLFTVQDSIAERVAAALALRLSTEEKGRLTKRYTDNAEVYRLYLSGRFFLNKRSPDGYKKAIDYFQQAIDKDPSYALAYSGLADSYTQLGAWQILPPGESLPKAKVAAERAVQLDDSLSEAHVSLGIVKNAGGDPAGAEAEYKRALELDPNSEIAHRVYGTNLYARGRSEEALRETRRALEIDPTSVLANSQLGRIFYVMRDYDQAIAQYQKTISMDPGFPTVHLQLGWVYEKKMMYPQAIAEYEKLRSLQGDLGPEAGIGGRGGPDARIARALALSGNKKEAQKILDKLKEMAKQDYVPPYNFALIYDGLGQQEEAIHWLEEAIQSGVGFNRFGIRTDPTWDNLRKHPRFQELLQRL